MLMVREDVKLLVIDYAELVQDDGASEEQRVTGIFKAAKHIARARNIPVIVLSQLNRQVENEVSKIPNLRHLRYGGEQVADSVWFTYYPYMYQRNGEIVHPPDEYGFQQLEGGNVEKKLRINKHLWFLVIGKARFGATGHVRFNVVPELVLITDYQKGSEVTGIVKLNTRSVEDDF
jgi:replicative DNA helicase